MGSFRTIFLKRTRMPRNWDKMTPEEQEAYNAKRRERRKALPESERTALLAARREAWASKEIKDKYKRLRKMRDYSLAHKTDYYTRILSLPKEEALAHFCRYYDQQVERIFKECYGCTPYFWPDDKTEWGNRTLKLHYDHWQNVRKYIWRNWLWKYAFIEQKHIKANPYMLPVDLWKRICIKSAHHKLAWNLNLLRMAGHACKWGHIKTPGQVESFAITEAWHMILLKLGRRCAKCGLQRSDFMWRPVLKADSMSIVPHTLHSLRAMIKNGLDKYELWCGGCHYKRGRDRTIRFRDRTPEQELEIRRTRPQWLATEEIRDGKRWEKRFIWKSDSHTYWRTKARYSNWLHSHQAIYLYKHLYPTADTRGWGHVRTRRIDLGTKYEHKCTPFLSKEFREFLRMNPPPGQAPLPSFQADMIYLKIFSHLGVRIAPSNY